MTRVAALFSARNEYSQPLLRRCGIAAKLRVNGYIKAKEVRVVAPDGEQIGVKKIEEALWLANELSLDLVEVAPDANPPVCRLMDFGKFKYEQSVRDREARKNQTKTVIKEVRLRPSTGEHDYQMVRRRVEKFLMTGAKVKVAVRFRGRENERPQLGVDMVNRLVEDLGLIVAVDQPPRKEGRMMNAMLSPNMTEVKRARKAARKAQQAEEAAELEEELSEIADAETAVSEVVEVVEEKQEDEVQEDEVTEQGEVSEAEPTQEMEGSDAESQDA